MFNKKCPRCKKKVSKKFDFCPFCSLDLRSREQEERDYGFLGKEDVRTFEDDLLSSMPLPFRMMVKPLMKELNKQMGELDKELRREQEGNVNKINGKPIKATTFKIHLGIPGQMPIELRSSDGQIKQINKKDNSKKHIPFPKINVENLKIANKLPKKEPETIVRRLSDSIIYEIKLPGVVSLESVGISKVARGFEIKAFSKKELFAKHIDLDIELVNYYFDSEILTLEFESLK